MRFSIIVPFQRGREYLEDCLESLKDQRMRIYFEVFDGVQGFEKLDRFEKMQGEEGAAQVKDFLKSREAKCFEELKAMTGFRQLRPYVDAWETKNGISLTVLQREDSDAGEDEHPFFCIPYRDFEVILVTDHPLDKISDIVAKYGKEFDIKQITLTAGSGVAAARNLGMANAEGDYVFFLDSDDYLFTSALAYMDQAVIRSDEPDLCYGKKIWTWYSRKGFITTYKAQKEQEELDAQADDAENSREEKEKAVEELSDEEMAKDLKMTMEEYEVYKRERAFAAAGRRLISRRKGIRNVSALGIAVKRSFVEENAISFPERFRYYSDLTFVAEILDKASSCRKNYAAKYIKRKHDDPIHFPSLAQEKSELRFEEFIAAYKYTRSKLRPDGEIIKRLDRKIIKYYTDSFVINMRRNEQECWRGDRFDVMRETVSCIPDETLKAVKLYRRGLIKALKAGDREKTLKKIARRRGFEKFFKCITSYTTIVRTFYVHRFLKKPVEKNYVMFECFFGKSYGDNPKAIYEHMQQTYGDKFVYIWSTEKRMDIPYKHKRVKRMGLRYAYYLAKSKYFVFNTKQVKWMFRRPEQTFLETWHGTPLKRLAFDMEDNFSAAPGYKKSIYSDTRSWDYMVSANAFSSEIFKRCFLLDSKMLEYGYPRNDILHRPDRDELAKGIRKKLGIPADKKTILYAPTWRDDEFYEAGKYKFTLKLDLPMLKAALKDEYVILLRTHYYIADKLDVTGMEGFAYNLSKYPDIADIYLISDICITDYSSVFFDYANLKRPMLFYTYDIDKYRDMLRGFYFDMESTVPGPLLYTTEEVIDAIKDIDNVSAGFAERYEGFYERFCGWEDGHASENIVKEVFAEELQDKN